MTRETLIQELQVSLQSLGVKLIAQAKEDLLRLLKCSKSHHAMGSFNLQEREREVMEMTCVTRLIKLILGTIQI